MYLTNFLSFPSPSSTISELSESEFEEEELSSFSSLISEFEGEEDPLSSFSSTLSYFSGS